MRSAIRARRLGPLITVLAVLVLAGGGLITASRPSAAQAMPTTAREKKPAQPGAASTSALSGVLGAYDYPQITVSNGYNTYVANDMWGCGSIQPPARGAFCGVQTVYAYSPGDWWVISTQAKGNTAVLTYPDVSQIYSDANGDGYYISQFGELTSSYTEHSPSIAGGDFEAAYDIWLDDGAKADEIMIWIDNHGQTPWGRVMAHAAIDGKRWAVWGVRNTGDTVSFVLNHRQASGTVNILDMLRWLQAHGYVNAGADVGQVDFGWEICSTGGKPARFSVSRYTLTSVSSQSA